VKSSNFELILDTNTPIENKKLCAEFGSPFPIIDIFIQKDKIFRFHHYYLDIPILIMGGYSCIGNDDGPVVAIDYEYRIESFNRYKERLSIKKEILTLVNRFLKDAKPFKD
tara:strand:+ start:172 stop:504 length:333 start_codon:yes stop_codon:yes gene_type:complete